MAEEKIDILEGAIKIELKAGRKCSFCTCGHSKKIPYCDDSHKKINEEQGTSYKPFKIIPEKDCTLCVSSSNWPNQKNKSL
ncbi:CDGSH iron-sulfur domain-containing protein [Candidatus Woesearchaeota archaeon]|nr:CDGSH iron-sulfur domain-containing protein [Candidatus Woesearchaeota archaeon]